MILRPAALASAVLTLLLLAGPSATAGPGQGTLFATDASNGNLITVHPATGLGTVVGSMGFPAPALAVDPATGVLYTVQGTGTPEFFTVNPATGATTLVGGTMLGFASVGSLDFDAGDGRHGLRPLGSQIPGCRKSSPDHPPILQAFDSKWWGWQSALKEISVKIHFLCREEIEAKYQEKMSR